MNNNTPIQIESGIPVPESNGGKTKYPFAQLEVGQSFLVPHAAQSAVCACFYHYKPKQFTSRKVEGGVRVWRTA